MYEPEPPRRICPFLTQVTAAPVYCDTVKDCMLQIRSYNPDGLTCAIREIAIDMADR